MRDLTTAAGDYVFRLVSGYPEPMRSGRLLYVLQALVDESESYGEHRVFALGGYIAPAKQWAAMADEWKAVLDLSPRIEYFSFKEAFPASGKPNGQFRGWTLEERNQRVALLRRVIEAHVSAEFGLCFLVDAYQNAYAHWGKPHQNPYYFATASLMPMVARSLGKLGLPPQQLDFIFDERKIEQDKVLEAWKWATSNAKPDPPDLMTKVLRQHPFFMNDEDFVPLQAADMCAGWWRSWATAKLSGKDVQQIPGFRKNLPGMLIQFSEQQMRESAGDLPALVERFPDHVIKKKSKSRRQP